MKEYTKQVKDIVANHKSYGMIFKKFVHLKQFVIDRTDRFLSDPIYTFRTKLYWIVHDLTNFPRCKYCDKPLEHKNIDSVQRGYSDFCCNSHGQLMRKKHSDNPYIKRTNIIDVLPENLQ